jgi:uncharacterized protein (DUF433 family)
VLDVLRNQYSVPLQHLRKVAFALDDLADEKWTATTLFVLNKRVVFVERDTDQYREIVTNQYVIGLPLQVVYDDTRRNVEAMQTRDRENIGKLSRTRNVNHNALVIAGTRIPVATIKRFAEDGYSVEQIMEEYPSLTADDVQAAINYEDDGLAA